MRCIRRLLVGVMTVATSGCIGSLDAVVTESEALFDPRLLGTWDDPTSSEYAVITRGGPRDYAIQYTRERDTVSLIGRLGRDRDRFILDLQPAESGLGSYQSFVVGLHIPVFVDSIGARARISILEPDSLVAFLRARPSAIAHLRRDSETDGLLLTATSSELRRFLAMYIQRPGALSAPETWTRRADSTRQSRDDVRLLALPASRERSPR